MFVPILPGCPVRGQAASLVPAGTARNPGFGQGQSAGLEWEPLRKWRPRAPAPRIE